MRFRVRQYPFRFLDASDERPGPSGPVVIACASLGEAVAGTVAANRRLLPATAADGAGNMRPGDRQLHEGRASWQPRPANSLATAPDDVGQSVRGPPRPRRPVGYSGGQGDTPIARTNFLTPVDPRPPSLSSSISIRP